jgi:hypothetical protein
MKGKCPVCASNFVGKVIISDISQLIPGTKNSITILCGLGSLRESGSIRFWENIDYPQYKFPKLPGRSSWGKIRKMINAAKE